MVVQGNNLSYYRSRGKRYGRKSTRKITRILQSNAILIFKAMNNLRSGIGTANPYNGYYALKNGRRTPAPLTSHWLPIHVYDLSSFNNRQSSGPGNIIKGEPAVQLYKNDITNQITTERLVQQGIGTGSTTQWIQFMTSDTNLSAAPGSRSIWDYFDARFCLRGTTNQATTFYIDLIQLNDQVLPFSWPDAGPVGLNIADPRWVNRTLVVEELIRPLIYNPILDVNPTASKLFKRLESWKFNMEAQYSDDNDAMPPTKIVKIFRKMNRVCNWNWNQEHVIQNQAEYLTGSTFPIPADNDCYVHPNARIYLVVRALNPLYSTDGDFTSYKTPSYDVQIKVKHTFSNTSLSDQTV